MKVLGPSAWDTDRWEPAHTEVITRVGLDAVTMVRAIDYDEGFLHMRSNVYHDGAACGESAVRSSRPGLLVMPPEITCVDCAAILTMELIKRIERWDLL